MSKGKLFVNGFFILMLVVGALGSVAAPAVADNQEPKVDPNLLQLANQHPAGTPAARAAGSHCLVCVRPSPDRICEACAARIRGEALERLLEDEKVGRRGSAV